MGRRLLTVLAAWLIVGWCEAPASQDEWSALEKLTHAVTRAAFERDSATIYSPSGQLTHYLAMDADSVRIFSTTARDTPPLARLRFSPTNNIAQPPIRLRNICLDPGHIGGEWARTEERFFARGADRPVQEAVLNLIVARHIRRQLEARGITVFMTKDGLEPVTKERPEDFRAAAIEYVNQLDLWKDWPPIEREAARADAIRKRQELLFYRTSEIRARARLVNEIFQPDLTLAIHFNAAPWNHRMDLVADNRLVVFTHGNYLPAELADDNQKLRLFSKLLRGTHRVELPIAEALAMSLARATGLPPVRYPAGGRSHRVGPSPYVYARNLAANRLMDGPVVYLEPYYMNNRVVYQRIQMGDYEGLRMAQGRLRKSIFREYADAVVAGLEPFLESAGLSP